MMLSDEQQDVGDQVDRFISQSSVDRESRVFTLHGLAGTGKTHLWAHLARKHRGATLVTPTGKAASVLRKRSGLEVKTIHSVIYDFRGLTDDKYDENRKNPVFVEKNGLDLSSHVVFADEVSMIGQRLANDLLATGATIIACGDPGQLPPVNDIPFFTKPDAELTEIHRQAQESPIIRQAHNVRNTGMYEPDGEGFQVISFAEPRHILGADIILCYANITRKRLNSRKRQLLDFAGPLRKGEPVMCLKNNHVLGIQNGAVYRMARDRDTSSPLLILNDEASDRSVHVSLATVEGEHAFDIQRYNDRFVPFAPAYACTVHKAQGSEFPSVLLFDEKPRGAERVSFLYTGITRAVEKCTVVSWR